MVHFDDIFAALVHHISQSSKEYTALMDVGSGLTCRDGFLVPLSPPNSTTTTTLAGIRSSAVAVKDGYDEEIKVQSSLSEPYSYSTLTDIDDGDDIIYDTEPLDRRKPMTIIVVTAHLLVAIGFVTLFVTELYQMHEMFAI